jgi:hypothetical protein
VFLGLSHCAVMNEVVNSYATVRKKMLNENISFVISYNNNIINLICKKMNQTAAVVTDMNI